MLIYITLTVAGNALSPDFFIDVNDVQKLKTQQASALSGQAFVGESKLTTTKTTQAAQGSESLSPVGQTFSNIQSRLNGDIVKSVGGVFAFDLKGNNNM